MVDQDLTKTATSRAGVFIGRFQPFHNGHLHVVRRALERVDALLILVGSSDKPAGYFNPWSYKNRVAMIRAALADLPDPFRVSIRALPDQDYDDVRWISSVRTIAEKMFMPKYWEINLVGHRKDGTSYYQSRFPDWGAIDIDNHAGLSATNIRRRYFTTGVPVEGELVPPSVVRFLAHWREAHGSEFRHVEAEHQFAAMYGQPYEKLPFPPVFITVDACVMRSGHVLVVERANMPGRGLWAMPGGFLEASERIEDAVYRELVDETGLDVPEETLRAATIRWRVYDAPHRSCRGRVVTHAAFIDLGNGEFPGLLPDPAEAAEVRRVMWKPLAEIVPQVMFEDHYAIINTISRG